MLAQRHKPTPRWRPPGLPESGRLAAPCRYVHSRSEWTTFNWARCRQPVAATWFLIALALALAQSGCMQQRYLTRRENPNFFTRPISALTRKDPRPTARTVQLLRRVRPGRPATEKAASRAHPAAARDRDRPEPRQNLLVRGVVVPRWPAAGTAAANPKTLSMPTPRRSPMPTGFCSIRSSIAFAIRTIPSSAGRAICITIRWPRRCGW